jgi:hypothetical protein
LPSARRPLQSETRCQCERISRIYFRYTQNVRLLQVGKLGKPPHRPGADHPVRSHKRQIYKIDLPRPERIKPTASAPV